ncbi:uncharacterized protein LOC141540381 isoform X3 [Sminthopsis crassicaudata]|uniref:uncharacterized protein LOC141540381 isoform X3 n=1 Tax=Sminthopsis crassicaudata TaxID=9301 RepID=UPI003D689256
MEAGAALEAGALVLRDRAHSQALALPQNGTTESEVGVTFGFLTAEIQWFIMAVNHALPLSQKNSYIEKTKGLQKDMRWVNIAAYYQ